MHTLNRHQQHINSLNQGPVSLQLVSFCNFAVVLQHIRHCNTLDIQVGGNLDGEMTWAWQ